MNKSEVGIFIAEKRKSINMTQKDLAEKLNITDKAVSRWETGKSYPDIEMLEKLAKVFEVSINDILNGKETVPEIREAVADKNIVEVMKQTKKVKKKSKIIISVLIVLLLISSIVLVTLVNQKDIETYEFEVETTENSELFNEILTFVQKKCYIYEETVCTGATVEYNPDGTVNDISMTLWDNNNYEIIIKTTISEDGSFLVSVTKEVCDYDIRDGVLFSTFMELLINTDIVDFVKNQVGEDVSNGVMIDCDSLSYRTFSENENIPFAETDYSYILENGRVEAINSTGKLSGKCYLVSLVAWPDKNQDVGVSCAIVYIKR